MAPLDADLVDFDPDCTDELVRMWRESCVLDPGRGRRSRQPMTWERWRSDNRAGWDNRVDIHTGPKGYDVDALLLDPQRLSPTIEMFIRC